MKTSTCGCIVKTNKLTRCLQSFNKFADIHFTSSFQIFYILYAFYAHLKNLLRVRPPMDILMNEIILLHFCQLLNIYYGIALRLKNCTCTEYILYNTNIIIKFHLKAPILYKNKKY